MNDVSGVQGGQAEDCCAQVFELGSEVDAAQIDGPSCRLAFTATGHCAAGARAHWLEGLTDPVLALDTAELAAIEAALRRIYLGSGSRCGECGKPIAVARLAVTSHPA
ncbi:hypothetical protein BH10PSE17_BH10PSE17_19980 [soil metagenome]